MVSTPTTEPSECSGTDVISTDSREFRLASTDLWTVASLEPSTLRANSSRASFTRSRAIRFEKCTPFVWPNIWSVHALAQRTWPRESVIHAGIGNRSRAGNSVVA